MCLAQGPQRRDAGEAQTLGLESSTICVQNNALHTFTSYRECSGSVVECLSRDQGVGVRASLVSLHCVLEQDTLILA